MIYLLRHGETEFNRDGRYQGRTGSPLTELGWRQAADCARALAGCVLENPRIWTSPLPRAAETARLIAAALPQVPVTADDRLAEVSMGDWDGLTKAQIKAGWPGARKAHPPRRWMFHAPGGERIEAVLTRLAAVLQDARAAEGDVILVGHGIAGRLLRGLHAGLAAEPALRLEAVQGMVYRLHPQGGLDTVPLAPQAPD